MSDAGLEILAPAEEGSRLERMPVSFFAMVMGLAGLSIVHLKAAPLLWGSAVPGVALSILTAGVFTLLAVAYAAKAIFHGRAVAEEFASPIKLQFFPTISISLLLLSICFLHVAPAASFVLWTVGAVAQLLLTLTTLSIWIQKQHFEIHHIQPTWFIPVVGNILVPIAGVEHAHADISWFFFSLGLVFWVALFTVFLYRIIFHDPMPERLVPTFFILIAPPAVGFISYVKLVGEVDPFARILYYFAVFLLVLLLFQWRMFWKTRFFISAWAYSFPIAALTVATIVMSKHTDFVGVQILAYALIAGVTLVVGALSALTARAVWRREICTPGH